MPRWVLGNDMEWRVRALRRQLEAHAKLNAELGVSFSRHADALRVAKLRGVRRGYRLKAEFEVLALAHSARHDGLGGEDLWPEYEGPWQ